MKNVNKFIALIAIVAIVPFLAGANSSAPGIDKKVPLVISDVEITVTPTSATVSWSTSMPSEGSIIVTYEFDAVGYDDKKFGTDHSVTVPGLAPGGSYPVTIVSYSKIYGPAKTVSDVIHTPVL